MDPSPTKASLQPPWAKSFTANFYGNLEKPRDLCQAYKVDIEGKAINMIFRNVVYSDLIGFHFGKMDSHQAAWELYDRIKDIQEKLVHSSDNHLLNHRPRRRKLLGILSSGRYPLPEKAVYNAQRR